MTVNLRDFIVTGAFGQCRIGTTQSIVSSLFGRPDGVGPVLAGRELFWTYGKAVLHWTSAADPLLKFIHIDLLSNAPEDRLKLDYSGFRAEMPLATALDIIRSIPAKYSIQERHPKWDYVRVSAGAGVRLIFNDRQEESDEPVGLLGFEYAEGYPVPS